MVCKATTVSNFLTTSMKKIEEGQAGNCKRCEVLRIINDLN